MELPRATEAAKKPTFLADVNETPLRTYSGAYSHWIGRAPRPVFGRDSAPDPA